MGKKKAQSKAENAGLKKTGGGLLSLEPRFMFDAAGFATGAEVAADNVAESQAEAALDSGKNHSGTSESTDVDQLMSALAGAPATEPSNEIIFIDTTVRGYEALLEGIDPGAEVVLLEAGQDGLAQMLDVLEGRSDIDAIHIISHGEAGELQLGTTTLDLDSMQGEYADELALISDALSASADILIYGCNFAEGETGLQAVQALGALTGADIAASTDLTGHADAGADWELEYESGSVEATAIVSQAAQEAFVGLLMDTDGDGIDDSTDIDDDNDGILDTVEGIGQTATVSSGELQVAQNPDGNASSTLTTTISLAATGLSVGDEVTVYNFLSNGDLNVTSETFSINFNNGEETAANLYTPGSQFGGFQPLSVTTGSFPNTYQLDVVDIDDGPGVEPGLRIVITANNQVDDFSTFGYAMALTFDIDYINPIGADTDGDGIEDHLDIDSDNDGITDTVEAQTTQDYIIPSGSGSGIEDDNNDGLDDSFDAGQIASGDGSENGIGFTPVDSDGDGIPDLLDDDSDGDGIPDIEERDDQQPTAIGGSTTDTDQDGLLDIFESSQIIDNDVNDENLTGLVFNLGDSDNDLAPDGSDAVGLAQNLDYRENVGRDADQDGIEDDFDLDSDNDGIINTNEGFQSPSGTEQSANLSYDTTGFSDPNFIEVYPVGGGTGTTNIDIDLSGVLIAGEGLEVGDTITIDGFRANGDLNGGTEYFSLNFNNGEVFEDFLTTGQQFTGHVALTTDPSYTITVIDIDPGPGVTPGFNLEIVISAGVDNGFFGAEVYGLSLDFDVDYTIYYGIDSDGDGVEDHLDIDSDNDGITDTVEAQLTNNYRLPSGVGAGITDLDTNGLDDNLDPMGDDSGLDPIDSDNDTIDDFLDSDSDNDGIDDIEERGDGAPTSLPMSPTDTDGDGLLDIFEGSILVDQDINDDNVSGTSTATLVFNLSDSDGDTDDDGQNAVPPSIDLDYREDQLGDIDNDGLNNSADLDADNDGIINTNEGFGPTTISSGEINSILAADNTPTTETVAIDLSEYGLAIGRTVTISNLQAEGGMANGSPNEDFVLTINPGDASEVSDTLTTGQDYGGLVTLATSISTVTVIDIDGNGTPGIIVELDPDDAVVPINAQTNAVQVIFDISFTSMRDVDSDGLPDYLDIDSDNDGITDNVEAQTSDNYIFPVGTDSDVDGLDNAYEGAGDEGIDPVDTDGDGRDDFIDLDSDQDSRPDVAERGDGAPVIVTDGTDTDGDGLLDIFEGGTLIDTDVNDENISGTSTATLIFNLADLDNDTDDDGGNADPGATPEPNDFDYRDGLTDFDGDGIPDSSDVDADGDGILNVDERSDQGGSVTVSGIEIPDVGGPNFSNGGLVANVVLTGVEVGDTVYITNVQAHGDLDSDFSVEWFRLDINSGEFISSNLTVNAEFPVDGGGAPIFLPVTTPIYTPVTVVDLGGGDVGITYLITTPEGVNEIGFPYGASVNFDIVWDAPDFDNDGQPDWLDVDKDNDGITDNVEAQTTVGYIAPTGLDDDSDGLDNAYETVGAGGTEGIDEVDTDGDLILDTYDSDTDNDGVDDIAERGDGQPRNIFSTADADADGLLDIFEGGNLFDSDPNDENLDPTDTTFNLSNSDGTGDLDYREATDTDGDGIPNILDADADNDGILNVDEGLTAIPGSLTSSGIDINTTSTSVTTIPLPDLNIGDTVSVSNLLADGDLDTSSETFTLTFNGADTFAGLQTGESFTGPMDLTSPVNLELTVIDIGGGQPGISITTSLDSTNVTDEISLGYAVRFTVDVSWTAPDTDGDGIFDYLDLDSDNDGLSDLFESGSAAGIAADTNNDGTVSISESPESGDGDGVVAVFETTGGTIPQDTDGDGVDDVRDLDSDGDGISDTIEFRSTAGFVANDGDVRDDDADGDGIIDIYDANDGTTGDFGGTFSVIGNDADGDGTPDYLDLDSDNDGTPDSAESGFTLSGTDANLDGIDDDASIGVSYADPDGVVTTNLLSGLADQVTGNSEVGFRESDLLATDDVVQIGEVNESTGADLSTDPIGNDNYSLPGNISVASVSSATTGGPIAVPDGGGTATVTITTDLGAQVTINDEGDINYNPNGVTVLTDLNFGDAPIVDSFSYTIETDDGSGVTASATVEITVEANNEFELEDVTNGDGSYGTTFNGAATNDQAGFNVIPLGDINGDGYDDIAIAAVTESTNATYSGATYVVFGNASGLGATFELSTLHDGGGTNGFVLRGIDLNDLSGRSATGGDINGDGLADIVIGAVNADPNGDKSGEVYVIYGRTDFSTILSTAPGDSGVFELSSLATGDGSNGFVFYGIALGDKTARWVDYAGDVNGDGFGDLLIGAPGADSAAGETYLIFGSDDFTTLLGSTPGVDSGIFELSQLAGGTGTDGTVFNGEVAGDNSGNFVAGAGDFNGDGLADIVIGAYYAGASYEGSSYLIYGDSGGFGAEVDLGTLNGTNGFELVGAAGDYSGKSVDLFDFNGDGLDDILVATYGSVNGYSYNGVNYVIFGETGTPFSGSQTLTSVADVTINGIDENNASGFKITSAGDINSDGFDDLFIGRVPVAGVDQGAGYIIFGSDSYTSGTTIEMSDIVPDAAGTVGGGAGLTVDAGFVLSGIDVNDYAGQAVATAGDFNGDGFDDLLIGAYTANPNGTYSGEAYLIYGKDFLLDEDLHITGTTGPDSLSGTIAQELIVGGDGNDLLSGGLGDDALFGGNGDDTLVYEENDSNTVDGGGGMDTLSFIGRAGLTLDLTTTSNNLYTDIEVIDLTGLGDNHLILSTLDLLALSGSTNILTVNGNTGDSVTLSGSGWMLDTPISGYTVYTNGEAEIRIQTGISITVSDLADEYKAEEAPQEHEIQQQEVMLADAGGSPVEMESFAGLPTFSQQLMSAHGQFAQRADTLMNALNA